jgi:hypothetical protein
MYYVLDSIRLLEYKNINAIYSCPWRINNLIVFLNEIEHQVQMFQEAVSRI